jgi:hypothetical protein
MQNCLVFQWGNFWGNISQNTFSISENKFTNNCSGLTDIQWFVDMRFAGLQDSGLLNKNVKGRNDNAPSNHDGRDVR